VDNAIVVIENIYRHLEQGKPPTEAASKGASEVGVAILASTLTTVSVFLPIVYVQGLAGELFKDQAWTVAYSLLCSLVVAMTTVPMLSARFLKHVTMHPNVDLRSQRYFDLLNFVLNRKLLTLSGAMMVLLFSVYCFQNLQSEFIPREDQGVFEIEMILREGSRLELTDKVSHRLGEIIQEVGGSDVAHVYIHSGNDPAQISLTNSITGPNRATLTVVLSENPNLGANQFIGLLEPHFEAIPDATFKYNLHETALMGVIGKETAPVQVDVIGDNIDILTGLAESIRRSISVHKELYNVQTSFQGGQPEVDLDIREEVAAAFGLNTQSISRTVEQQLSGEIAGELSKDQRTRHIRVGFEDVEFNELNQLRLETTGGAVLTLGDVVDMQIVDGPREILREDQRRVGRVTAHLTEGYSLSQAVARVQESVRNTIVPSGYRVIIGGEERERSESFANLKFALILSLILVYMVMASLFESLLHPLTVILSVPLAGVGVVVSFWLIQEPLSVMAYIGVIMLGGIAVNDAIVLVDRINQLRQNHSLREAILKGTQDRLRPILMTSATTILALFPMVLGIGDGSQLRSPMAIAVIGGLISSTLMTLVIIPIMYEVIERLRVRVVQ